MPNTTISVKLTDLPAVQATLRSLFRLLHEVEAADPALLPDQVRERAEDARAIVDEWRKPNRHARRHTRD